MQLKSKKVGK